MSRPPPKKTQPIRDILTAAGRPLNIDELQPRLENKLKQIIGRRKLYMLLAGMKTTGEIETVGRGDDCFYALKRRKAKP